ncbi:MAG TPA: glycosyltransferase [Thermoanaerobaculia bacterium]|nr:glycosyltransferase [Thermoanaerobaculia bacterium]
MPHNGEADLPHVSVIVAFRGESEATFRRSAEALRALHYPHDRLQVIWVVDRGDEIALERARAAAGAMSAPEWKVVEAIRPRAEALNAGLAASSGEVFALFDADAVPEPSQLRKAVDALRSGRWQAVESPQFVDRGARPWLTALIRAEAACWFASMQSMDWFTGTHMLAGSSIYFTRQTYEQVGSFFGPLSEEPIDWSLRFANLGLQAGVLDSISLDIPIRNAWSGLLQRRRWIKGQTECLMRRTKSLSAGRALLLAVAVLASNFAVLLVLPVLLLSAFSAVAFKLLLALVALEALRIGVTALTCGDFHRHVPTRGWFLLLPWELASTIGYWLGVLDWCTGRQVWDQARS